MNDPVADVLSSVEGSSILIDTNLLLLLLVGTYDVARIARFKRTAQFLPEDFELLVAVIGRFRTVFTTPHILTETSNLLGQLSGQIRDDCFAKLADAIQLFDEVSVPGRQLAQHDAFRRIGLTDTGILELSARKCLVLTDDFLLYSFLMTAGAVALNFNHLRSMNWR